VEAFIRTMLIKYRLRSLKVSASFKDWLPDYHCAVLSIQEELAEWIAFRRDEVHSRKQESDMKPISFTELRESYYKTQKDRPKFSSSQRSPFSTSQTAREMDQDENNEERNGDEDMGNNSGDDLDLN
jgi:hypothetical protein